MNENFKHLSAPDQENVLNFFTKFDDLLDGVLGDCDTAPFPLKQKECTKPHSCRPFQNKKDYKETLQEKVQRLCDLGIMKWQPESSLAFPSCIVQNMKFGSGFKEVNN